MRKAACQNTREPLRPLDRPQPRHLLRFPVARIVESESVGMCAHDFAETLRVRVEIDVTEKAADEYRALLVIHVEPDKAIGGMPERLPPEVFVVSEKRRLRQA